MKTKECSVDLEKNKKETLVAWREQFQGSRCRRNQMNCCALRVKKEWRYGAVHRVGL